MRNMIVNLTLNFKYAALWCRAVQILAYSLLGFRSITGKEGLYVIVRALTALLIKNKKKSMSQILMI